MYGLVPDSATALRLVRYRHIFLAGGTPLKTPVGSNPLRGCKCRVQWLEAHSLSKTHDADKSRARDSHGRSSSAAKSQHHPESYNLYQGYRAIVWGNAGKFQAKLPRLDKPGFSAVSMVTVHHRRTMTTDTH